MWSKLMVMFAGLAVRWVVKEHNKMFVKHSGSKSGLLQKTLDTPHETANHQINLFQFSGFLICDSLKVPVHLENEEAWTYWAGDMATWNLGFG